MSSTSEGCTSVTLSPGLNPHVAVLVAEKKGAPAAIQIYGLLTLSSSPTSQKAFYKADRAKIKWNALGTQALVLTQTEVDKINKSYYGETGLYLLSAAGNFDCRVTLDKEGPISDLHGVPTRKNLVSSTDVGHCSLSRFPCSSYPLDMPAKTVLFDQRVRMLHDFGSSPTNCISFT